MSRDPGSKAPGQNVLAQSLDDEGDGRAMRRRIGRRARLSPASAGSVLPFLLTAAFDTTRAL